MSKPGFIVFDTDAIYNVDDLADVTITSAADNDVLAYDTATSKWINQTASSGLGLDARYFRATTEDALLAITPATVSIGYATDTARLFIWDGSTWYQVPVKAVTTTSSPDMGMPPGMVENARTGYGVDYIADKSLNYVTIGSGANSVNGAFRLSSSGTFQIYANGVWNDIVINFRLREDSTNGYEFEHKPIGFNEWIEIFSGNSNTLGMNGLPIIQQYKTSMGAYPVPLVLNGGTF